MVFGAGRGMGPFADLCNSWRYLRRGLYPDGGRRSRAVYAFLIANFVYCDMGPFAKVGKGGIAIVGRAVSVLWHPDTKKTLFEAGKLTVTLMFIIANALILKHVLTEERIPQQITEVMLTAGFGPIIFLVFVNILLLIGGQFMEPSGLLIIVAPLVFPIAIMLDIDPIHLGIIIVVSMEIGMITPPVGLNLFVTVGVAAMSVMNAVKAALRWVGIMFIFLILVTYVPWISTVIPIAPMALKSSPNRKVRLLVSRCYAICDSLLAGAENKL